MPEHMRMGDAGNHIHHIAVLRQDSRQRLDDVFDALVWREQSKREQNFFSLSSKGILVETWVRESQMRNAMWDQINLGNWHMEYFLQDFRRLAAHHDQAVR